MYRHLFKHETVEPISYATLTERLKNDENDELLEDAVRLHREISKHHDMIIVEGVLPNGRDPFATELNATFGQSTGCKSHYCEQCRHQQSC